MRKTILGIEMDIDLPEEQNSTSEQVTKASSDITATPAGLVYNSLYIKKQGGGEGDASENVKSNATQSLNLVHGEYIVKSPESPESDFFLLQDLEKQGFVLPATQTNEANQPQKIKAAIKKSQFLHEILICLDWLVKKTGKRYADCLDEAYEMAESGHIPSRIKQKGAKA